MDNINWQALILLSLLVWLLVSYFRENKRVHKYKELVRYTLSISKINVNYSKRIAERLLDNTFTMNDFPISIWVKNCDKILAQIEKTQADPEY